MTHRWHKWLRGYETQQQEAHYWVAPDAIDGHIPVELTGTLFRNGPGLLDAYGEQVLHPFDADGMVCAITFTNGRACFRNRFVQTAAFVAEQQAGRFLYRGTFGTQRKGGWLANLFDLRFKNVANTNIVYWAGRLLALWEGGSPYRLDPRTLDTLGEETLDGILAPQQPFSAHPRIAPLGNDDNTMPHLVAFGVDVMPNTIVTCYEFDSVGALVQHNSYTLPGLSLLHDSIVLPHHCLFVQYPISFRGIPTLMGWQGIVQCMTLRVGDPISFFLLPRTPNGSVETFQFTNDTFFGFHHANGYIQGDTIIADSVCYYDVPNLSCKHNFRTMDMSSELAGSLWRFVINRRTGAVQATMLVSRSCEFPSINPTYTGQPYRYVYLCTTNNPRDNAPHQALLKYDLHTGHETLWSAAPDGFVGEPVFVPRRLRSFPSQSNTTAPPIALSHPDSSEDDGWLLVLVYDAAAHRTDVVILDAQHLEQGAVARLHLRYHVPHGLHGSFVPDCFGVAEAMTDVL